MNKSQPWNEPSALRTAAEARLRQRPAPKIVVEADWLRTQHELEVHRIELEMQGEDLRRIQVEMATTEGTHRERAVVLEEQNRVLEGELAKARRFRKLLPICAECKKIRDEKGEWRPVEVYFGKHTDITFTHGLCPECLPKYFPDGNESPHSGKNDS